MPLAVPRRVSLGVSLATRKRPAGGHLRVPLAVPLAVLLAVLLGVSLGRAASASDGSGQRPGRRHGRHGGGGARRAGVGSGQHGGRDGGLRQVAACCNGKGEHGGTAADGGSTEERGRTRAGRRARHEWSKCEHGGTAADGGSMEERGRTRAGRRGGCRLGEGRERQRADEAKAATPQARARRQREDGAPTAGRGRTRAARRGTNAERKPEHGANATTESRRRGGDARAQPAAVVAAILRLRRSRFNIC